MALDTYIWTRVPIHTQGHTFLNHGKIYTYLFIPRYNYTDDKCDTGLMTIKILMLNAIVTNNGDDNDYHDK